MALETRTAQVFCQRESSIPTEILCEVLTPDQPPPFVHNSGGEVREGLAFVGGSHRTHGDSWESLAMGFYKDCSKQIPTKKGRVCQGRSST